MNLGIRTVGRVPMPVIGPRIKQVRSLAEVLALTPGDIIETTVGGRLLYDGQDTYLSGDNQYKKLVFYERNDSNRVFRNSIHENSLDGHEIGEIGAFSAEGKLTTIALRGMSSTWRQPRDPGYEEYDTKTECLKR